MTTFIIEPRDTALFRDGRPFVTGAASGRSLTFPWPSTLAGLTRTLIGTAPGKGFDTNKADALVKAVSVIGPWLAVQTDDGGALVSYFPAPRDCVWFKSDPPGAASRRVRLAPVSDGRFDGVLSSLRDSLSVIGLCADEQKAKPDKSPPFWSIEEIERWLVAPAPCTTPAPCDTLPELVRERRTHVAIEAGSQTASDGMLFSTESLRFTTRARRQVMLAFACQHRDLAARVGGVCIGGERRVAFLRTADVRTPKLPSLASDVRRLRVILLTPCAFAEGAVPEKLHGARVTAAVVGRPEIVSGWDMKAGQPKPTRRLVPAGSVFWVELDEGTDGLGWAEKVHMKSVAQDEQDALDGFGLALVGVA